MEEEAAGQCSLHAEHSKVSQNDKDAKDFVLQHYEKVDKEEQHEGLQIDQGLEKGLNGMTALLLP